LEDVKWGMSDTGLKNVRLNTKGGGTFPIMVDEKGIVKSGSGVTGDWQGKKLDEVLGKGLADKIMEKERGTLSGEGLKFGGEWADNLYDKQVGNIVKDLTGAKIEVLDMGLPIDIKGASQKTTQQQGIKLTPEVKNVINGISPEIKTSGKMFENHPNSPIYGIKLNQK
jgi:hypothetical protein